MLAAVAAVAVTSVFATYLVRRADDRRIMDAAIVLATELDEAPPDLTSIGLIVADEDREMSHTGIAFAVFDAPSVRRLAGDPRVLPLAPATCTISRGVHACATPTARGLRVVAATGHNGIASLLIFASAFAALLAGVGAWLASRPVAGLLIGPLSELRERVAGIDAAGAVKEDLGAATGIVEVDALRETISALLTRIGIAMRHAERFAADAAHELRTPLTTIRGELELLAEDATLNPDAVRDLTRAKLKVVELQTLVERLLVLALPDHSQWSAAEFVSVHDLIEDGVAHLPEVDRRRVSIRAASGDVTVWGDTALLTTMFSNALANALKFGSNVAVVVFEAGSDVVLIVHDDGVGVPEDQRTRVFEPFVRAPFAIEHMVPGHGLGLALIAHVARRHGGSVQFIDGPPGAHLEIRLPCAQAASQSPTAGG